ncbi:bifunctional sugar-1-phosphate nucleotidylyltransferase/acetyltransferase [Haladaptatus salinisoli]|uniref:bifunctional sugar-1-phosphate nucleotidylyltransferase/acetyltransferase n=1 Tax=Haladaptatus salinisoli TaxID=2884876 RepID=UPI001D0B2BD3|nr:bifunctional sugar-1-phosphate nucleotidylyltransferase/acetyltransferase [Haladaptatus salinisoli]
MTVSSAVVLAAGEGTRLRPLTRNRPKPMLPATTRPILEYVLDALVDAGIDRIHLVVGYRGDRVRDHFGSNYRGVTVSYAEQNKQLGSGHALLAVRDDVDDAFLVVNGDQIIEAEMVADVREAFGGGATNRDRPAAALAVIERADVGEYGAVVMDGDRVREIVEKPASDEYRLLNAGVYAFDERIFDAVESTPSAAGELALTDTLARLLATDAAVRGIVTDGLWVDATYPWDLLDVAHELLVRGRVSEPQRDDRLWVADSARVHDSAVLQPPVVVGSDCDVHPGAVVGPYATLGQGVTVGSNAVVERTVLDSDTRVGASATLVDCVTGQSVSLGPGTAIPGGPGDVRVNGSIFEEQQLGALLADRVRVGGNVSFVPGTLVGPEARIGPGVSVSGRVEEGATIVR